jgi:hypothetical protein
MNDYLSALLEVKTVTPVFAPVKSEAIVSF